MKLESDSLLLVLDYDEQEPFSSYPLPEMMTRKRALEIAGRNLEAIRAECEAIQEIPEEMRRRLAVMHDIITVCVDLEVADLEKTL